MVRGAAEGVEAVGHEMEAAELGGRDEEDQLTHDLDVQRERCLLFVACTRAREQLAVSWHGRPSPLLAALNA